MKIGVLTSSRADFGIYYPLLKQLREDLYFDLSIIAFGSHVSKYHGYTISEIYDAGFEKVKSIETLQIDDSPKGVSKSYGITVLKFVDYWSQNKFDLVFCLGDRFEMSAAVQAGIPFGIKFAHIHGGETTLGAIDNIYRDQITLASSIHFSATDEYKNKIMSIINRRGGVYNVGSLSLNDIDNYKFMPENEFRSKFKIPNKPYLLITFHPETVYPEFNFEYSLVIKKTLKNLTGKYFLVISMPNADTYGSIFKNVILKLSDKFPNQILKIENFGKANYFNAMKYSEFLLGNSSSGIIEAASFGKYVINIGNRQKGRAKSKNILDCSFNFTSIMNAVSQINDLGSYTGINIYQKPNTSKSIIDIIKNTYA